MDAYTVALDHNTQLLYVIILMEIVFFIISVSLAAFVFIYKLRLIKKLHKDFIHTKERKTQAVILLRQRKQELLEQSKRFNGK